MKLITRHPNLTLGQDIADYRRLLPTTVDVGRFADCEMFVAVHENVRGEDVIVQLPNKEAA